MVYLQHCPTCTLHADVMIKALPQTSFEYYLRERLGVLSFGKEGIIESAK